MTPRKSTALKSERTRRRSMSAAAAAYREHGIKGVGVREIMKRAGLTQGGFYFHFPDKDTLFREASREAAMSSLAEFWKVADSAPQGKRLQAFIDGYLSTQHRDHPESGCLMSALGGEVGRSGAKQRAAFNGALEVILERVAGYVPAETPAERRRKAGLLMASMAGVLMVARVLDDPSTSAALLAAARRFYSASFGQVQ
jgi:TetR/AcrR family transcriptional regulator, transcriptional repressor for nem operon